MGSLIRNIVQRMEAFASKGNDVFTTDRKSVVLETKNHAAESKKKKDKECC